MALGTRGNTEFLQERSDRVTKDHFDIAKAEGRITDNMTLAQINEVLVNYIKEAETTSSSATSLPSTCWKAKSCASLVCLIAAS